MTQQIQVHWEKGMHHLRFVQMHDAIDEVTILLREAQGYLQDRKSGEYLSVLGKLTGKLEALQEQERVSAENLF